MVSEHRRERGSGYGLGCGRVDARFGIAGSVLSTLAVAVLLFLRFGLAGPRPGTTSRAVA